MLVEGIILGVMVLVAGYTVYNMVKDLKELDKK